MILNVVLVNLHCGESAARLATSIGVSRIRFESTLAGSCASLVDSRDEQTDGMTARSRPVDLRSSRDE